MRVSVLIDEICVCVFNILVLICMYTGLGNGYYSNDVIPQERAEEEYEEQEASEEESPKQIQPTKSAKRAKTKKSCQKEVQ